jgi:hypothetical protein
VNRRGFIALLGGAGDERWGNFEAQPCHCGTCSGFRVRARLEALIMAERCSPLRCSIQADRQALPSGSHAERPLLRYLRNSI